MQAALMFHVSIAVPRKGPETVFLGQDRRLKEMSKGSGTEAGEQNKRGAACIIYL